MPVQPTYPGVYVPEFESPVHTITPVPTAVTAFIGRAQRGPVNVPIVCHSFADFEQIFGGLWLDSALGFAVSAFFLNGGGQAIVVRVYRPEGTSGDAATGKATLTIDGLKLRAQSPGRWGNALTARITRPDTKVVKPLADRYNVDPSALFNLAIRDAVTGSIEEFANVTVIPSDRVLDKVLANESLLVELAGPLPAAAPAPSADPVAGRGSWDEATTYTQADQNGSDGQPLDATVLPGNEAEKTGIYALERADIFNLLCIPPYDAGDVSADIFSKAAEYCERRRAILLVDLPAAWKKDDALRGTPLFAPSANAALYFPRIDQPNPLRDNRVETFAPCGAIAGVIARTDLQRGVWKAPAGLDAKLMGVERPSLPLTDAENGQLNPLGLNCLRSLPTAGNVIWGARTMVGVDRLASQWKYLPVRRTALFIEESLYRGTQWAVFEPNDEPLWAQLRLNIGVFMHALYRQGAFQGQSPQDAYFVKCDATTTTQSDIDRGIVNVIVGFAPLKPAEFVVLYIQQITGNVAI